MSGRADRKANSAWHPARNAEMLQLIIDAQRHREAEAAQRVRDVRADLAAAMREWFAHVELPRLRPGKDQLSDTVLGERIGLPHTAELWHKASRVMRFYGRTSEIENERWGAKIRCSMNCRELSAAKLRKAFERVRDTQLRQMRNPDLKAAGFVLSAAVRGDGFVDLTAVVTDATAAMKARERAYTGVLLTMDGDEISDVSLVDSPAGFLEKGARPDGQVIAKIYDGGSDLNDWKRAKKMARERGGSREEYFRALQRVEKAYAPALPPMVESALRERQRAEDAYHERPNEFTKAAFVRADTATRIAVMAAARPTAVGDAGLINFLRHGRP
jgi:hypothetical protein